MTEKAGHNSELTPQQRRALRVHHLTLLSNVDAEMKPWKDRRKQIRALAKADGFKLADLDAAYRLMNMEDQSIFVDEIREMIDIAVTFNALPPGEQGELFADRRPGDEKAFDEGVIAGLQAIKRKSPDHYQGDAEQQWLAGYDEGQRQSREALQAAMERRNVANDDAVITGANDDAPFADGAADDVPEVAE